MNKTEIYNTIKGLSRSQGYYCKILQEIEENSEILEILEGKNFTDPIDLILFLEV